MGTTEKSQVRANGPLWRVKAGTLAALLLRGTLPCARYSASEVEELGGPRPFSAVDSYSPWLPLAPMEGRRG
jgi:hypothetical protein